jgi:hypothetical protein
MPTTSTSPRLAPAERPAVRRTHVTAVDVLVYAAIVAIGVMHYALILKSTDFFTGDTIYFELARSILKRGFYGFNFRPEIVLPPGFPAVMAVLCLAVGCGHSVFVHAVVVFATLGCLASYELLRRLEGRTAAAVISLLLISSPQEFALATRMVFSDLPYFFTSMVALVLVRRLDEQCTTPEAKGEGAADVPEPAARD